MNYAINLVGTRREQRLGVYDAEQAAVVLAEFGGTDDVEYVRKEYVDALDRVPRTWTSPRDGKERPNRRALHFGGGFGATLELTIEITDEGEST